MFKCKVIQIILPLIQVALKSEDWRIIESGIFTLGIINNDGTLKKKKLIN